jgi:hypothetical protein
VHGFSNIVPFHPLYVLKSLNSCVSLSDVSHLLINRYKRLLCMVDLTKDFFFSYSYNIMRSFQKNICDHESGGTLYKKMFVWNEFLTRGTRHHLRNTLWTVALVYGFFKQTILSEAGRNFKLTLIARRSRHNAGTRYQISSLPSFHFCGKRDYYKSLCILLFSSSMKSLQIKSTLLIK